MHEPDNRYPQSQVDFFRELKPIPGAVSALEGMANSLHLSPQILTAPFVAYPLSYMEKRIWVERHLGDYWLDRFHISPRKDLFSFGILIDRFCNGNGQQNFDGFVLPFGQDGFGTWDDIVDLLSRIVSNSGKIFNEYQRETLESLSLEYQLSLIKVSS